MVIGDWYDERALYRATYADDNTQSTWHAVSGGANVPEINKVLDAISDGNMEFGVQTFGGKMVVGDKEVCTCLFCVDR
jgi:hypothetical protein